MKNWKQFTFMAIIAIVGISMGFVACGNGDNNEPQTYTVTIGALENGSISANPTSGIEGTEITLTVNPDNLYKLKAHTLKYYTTPINETTMKFTLPASNVIVTAEFESLFIGSWTQANNGQIWTFSEDEFTIQRSNGTYHTKGIWKVVTNTFQGNQNNILICTITHQSFSLPLLTTANDLPKLDEEIIEEFLFVFLSYKEFRVSALVFTLIE